MPPARDADWPARLAPLGLAVVALCVCVSRAQAASYPPELRFRTISTERVSVHFHQGLETMARQAAALATEILAAREQRYGGKLGRLQLVLVDAEDDPNGFASPLPYPLVTLHAVAPDGSDSFGNHEGWLRLALSHELSHVAHLEQARGIWGAGRHIFGRAPFLFPNSLAMTWMIEGLATYEETETTAFGRGRDPDARAVLRMAAADHRFPPEDRAIYALDAWPGGLASYLFGEAFLRHLSEQSGADTIPRLAWQHAGQLPPYLDGRSVRKVTGTGLHGQWNAWAAGVAEAAAGEASRRGGTGLTKPVLITARGIRQSAPRFSPDGAWIAYTSGTLTRFPEIRLVRPDGRRDHRLSLRNGGSGLAWTPDGRELVYSELQVHRTFSLFGDLSRAEVESGRVHRLTRGMRASDPDVSPDGRTIVFARKLGDRSGLFTVGSDGKGLAPLGASSAGVEWSGPRFSPAGDKVVASRLLPGGWLDIVLVDVKTGAVDELTHDRAKDVEPTWTPDGRFVVFRSDRDGVSNLYAVELGDRALRRLTNVLGGALQPSVSPDGRSVAFASYSSRGYDIALAPIDPATAPVAEAYRDDHPPPRPDPLPAAGPVEAYRPWSLAWPRFWSPWVENRDEEVRLGAASGGSDALFQHVWLAQAAYGTSSERANALVYYRYDRFRTSFAITGQDTNDVFLRRLDDGSSVEATRRIRRLTLQASFPLRRTVRSVQALSLTYRRQHETVLGSLRPEDRADLGGIETAWQLSSARSYPYSISPADGGQLTVAWLHAAPGLGSEDSFDKLTTDGRYYRRLLGQRDVLATRLSLGTSFGRPLHQPFSVGGYPDSALFDSAANLALLRGYPSDVFFGLRFAAANLEYRFPLFSPQRSWHSLPVFLRHLHGTVFFDAANAWSTRFRGEDVKTAAGVSLGLDTALGYALPTTGEIAFARGLSDRGEWKLYLRLGLAF